MEKAIEVLETMVLRLPTCVEKAGHVWQFRFGDGEATLNLECPWRLLLNGAVAFGGDDDGQQFGLPAPLDGVKETEKLLSASLVSLIEILRAAAISVSHFRMGFGWKLSTAPLDTKAGHVLGGLVSL